jgi:dienelactone hydrolase
MPKFSQSRGCLILSGCETVGFLALGFFTVCVATLHAQTLQVVPNRVLLDESPAIRATGLEPNERITIKSELQDGAGHHWAAQAEFIADAQGAVDLSQQSPVSGSYNEVSALGLIWSMKPSTKNSTIYQAPENLAPQTTTFLLLRNGKEISRAKLEQLMVADEVQQIKVEGALHGVLFVPATGAGTSARHLGVLVLGGSNGGVPLRTAAWLASHGFAALALAYFRYENLPPRLEAIPLEYFGSAIAWMMQRPEIYPDRLAVAGTSRGGELALQLASMYPQIKATVAYVPSNVRNPACCGDTHVPYAWTWHGKPLSFLSLRSANQPMAMLQAAIFVENSRGPILLISGGDDGVWPSNSMSNSIVARLEQHHFPYPVEHLNYPHAGHTAGQPGIFPAWHGRVRHPVSGREIDLGGKVEADAQSTSDAMPKVLTFLHKSLDPLAAPSN